MSRIRIGDLVIDAAMTDRAVLALADAEARRTRLARLHPDLPLGDAETILAACACEDRGRGEAAFHVALIALSNRIDRRRA